MRMPGRKRWGRPKSRLMDVVRQDISQVETENPQKIEDRI